MLDEGKPRMKETDVDREVRDGAYRVTAAELRQFIERFERLEAEKKDIALRKRGRADVAEEEAVLQLYRDALGV